MGVSGEGQSNTGAQVMAAAAAPGGPPTPPTQAREGAAAPFYERNRFCLDSDCAGIAEPEEESQGGPGTLLRWWRCSRCEMEFGYELVANPDAPGSESACQLGIPEGVRRAISIEPDRKSGPVFLGGIGRRPQLWAWI